MRGLLASALLLAACGAPAVAPADVTASVFLSEGGFMRPLANGARVALIEGGWATLTFSEFPPRDGCHLEIDLESTSATSVSVATEMVGMDHDMASPAALEHAGRYRVPLAFPMPGAYRVLVRVETAAGASTLTLVVAGGG